MEMTKALNPAASASYLASQQVAQKPASTSQKKQSADENISAAAATGTTRRQEPDSVKIAHNSASLKNLDTAGAIEQIQSKMNQLAKGVRETNEALNRIAEQTKQMQGETFAIIKNFPPFTRESLERKQILMSYASLKKEIDNMMVPPPPPPVYEHVRHMWETTFGQNGQILPTAVPSLETGSSDQEVQGAASALEQLGKSIDHLGSATNHVLLTP